jgi:hypothetical protein
LDAVRDIGTEADGFNSKFDASAFELMENLLALPVDWRAAQPRSSGTREDSLQTCKALADALHRLDGIRRRTWKAIH